MSILARSNLARLCLLSSVIVLVAAVCCVSTIRGREDPRAIAANDISSPGNAAAEGKDFLPASAFPDAKYCGHCHQEAYHQWRQSLHSNSFRTPFYRTSVNILLRTKGIEFTRHCDSCHNPVGVLTGGLTQDSKGDRQFDEDGL